MKTSKITHKTNLVKILPLLLTAMLLAGRIGHTISMPQNVCPAYSEETQFCFDNDGNDAGEPATL